MNDMIKVDFTNDAPAVSARELHSFLEVKTAYKDWFPRMCEYGFIEGVDFSSFLSKSTGGRPAQDAILTLDMAKEICMLQRNEKGKLARQHFIEVEKAWNSPEKVMARALRLADQKIKALETQIEQDAPKVLFADAVSASDSDILVRDMAKILKQNGVEIGQNRLFQWMRERGYLIKQRGTDWNMPTQRSMNQGLFRVQETAVTRSDGHISVYKVAKAKASGISSIRFFGGAEMKLRIERREDGFTVEMEREPMPQSRFDALIGIASLVIQRAGICLPARQLHITNCLKIS